MRESLPAGNYLTSGQVYVGSSPTDVECQLTDTGAISTDSSGQGQSLAGGATISMTGVVNSPNATTVLSIVCDASGGVPTGDQIVIGSMELTAVQVGALQCGHDDGTFSGGILPSNLCTNES